MGKLLVILNLKVTAEDDCQQWIAADVPQKGKRLGAIEDLVIGPVVAIRFDSTLGQEREAERRAWLGNHSFELIGQLGGIGTNLFFQRFVQVEEVADATVFLASNGAVNGSALRVEGGIIRSL